MGRTFVGLENLGWLADSVDSAGEYVDVPRTRETSYRHDAVTCT